MAALASQPALQPPPPDVAELQGAEEKLRGVLQLSLSAADAGTFRLDYSDENVPAGELTLTDQSKQVLGFSPSEQVPLSALLDRVVDPPDRERFMGALQSLGSAKSEHIDIRFRINVPSNATTRFIDFKGDALCLLASGKRMAVGIVMNVTQRAVQDQQRIDDAQERAHKAEEMHVQGKEFIATMCHEIRNPLQGAMGASTLLRDDLRNLKQEIQDPESTATTTSSSATTQARPVAAAAAAAPTIESAAVMALRSAFRNLDIIDECTRQEKEIADDVLDMARISAGKLELHLKCFPLHRLFDSLVTMFAAVMQLREIHLDVLVPEIQVRADYIRLLQVCVNVISNAIKFTLHGGTIAINVSLEQNGLLHVIIEDTGVGMSAKELSQLFQRFSTSAGETAGTIGGGAGLGLSVAKKLVDLMHGTLEFTSAEGSGTRAYLRIPVEILADPSSMPASTTPAIEWSHSRTVLQHKHVLVVDDNVIVRLVLERFLQSIGCTFVSATNGTEAVALVKHSPTRFDAILMDVHMPTMDGIEATRRIREIERQEKRPPVWIIGISGDLSIKARQSAMQGGMNDYLSKPYQREGLLAALNCIGQPRLSASDSATRESSSSSSKHTF